MSERIRLKAKEIKDEVKEIEVTCHAEITPESIKQDDDTGDLFIEGFASTTHVDRTDEIVESSSFKRTLKDFLKNPILMLNHGMTEKGRVGVGKVVEAEIREGKGLWVKAFISKAEDELRIKIKEGIYKAFSFGFRILDSHIDKIAGKAIRKITNLELLEVSVVSIPANRRALFSVAKAFEFGTDLVYENEFVEGIKGDLDSANKRINAVENSIKDIKESGTVIKTDVIGNCVCADSMNSSSKESCLMCNDNKHDVSKVPYRDCNCQFCKEARVTESKNIKAEATDNEITNLQKEVDELKAGRVLSGKNREVLQKALVAMQEASVLLKAFVDIEESSEMDNLKPKKKPKKEDSDTEVLNMIASDNILNTIAEQLLEVDLLN